jgi:drug/metabolite transporter (DMT)-like permease
MLAGGAYVVAFYRGAIGLLFVIAWLALRPQRSGFGNPRLWLWSIVAGIGIAGNFGFYFLGISEGSVSVAATLMYCAPVFVFFVSFVLGLEHPSWTKFVAIIVVMFGIVLLTRVYESGAGSLTPLAIGSSLLAGLSYAIFIFGFKFATPYGSPQAILAIALAVLVILLLGPASGGDALAVIHAPSLPLFILLGVLGAGLSFIIYVVGLRNTAPGVASIVAMIEPVTASLFGVLVLDETLGGLQLFGMLLILATATILSIRTKPRWPGKEIA